MEITSDHVNREFGFCKILWRIENFCLATCKDGWKITSPAFTVRASSLTTWMIILNSKPVENEKDEDCFVSAALKRLESEPGPEIVRANWKMGVLNGKTNEYSFADTKGYFRKNTTFHQDLQKLTDILKEFQPFETDVLYLQCQLVVSVENSAEFNICSEQGIRTLSDDLSAFYASEKASDVILKIKDRHIHAHKAILYVRNPTLARIFDSNPEIQFVDLFPTEPPSSPEADELFHEQFMNSGHNVEKFIAYLYSGNLQFVIGEPSVSIYECALMLDASEVIQFYTPDELNFESGIDAEEMVFFWIIRDFESITQNCILSPPLTAASSETIWRLRLLPKGAENRGEYISIFAEITKGTVPQEICLEFAITDVSHEFCDYKRIRKSIGFGEILGFADFAKIDSLKDSSFLENGALRIIFKLRVSAGGEPTSSQECSSVYVVTANSGAQEALDTLSEDMSCLYEGEKFSDAAIHCEDKVFNVHKCILSARSDALSAMLREKLAGRNEIHFSDIKPDIFNILLFYIYTGTIGDFNQDVIYEVYKTAEQYGMYGLMTKSLQIFNGIQQN